jgi:hypothetical protein
MTLSSSSFKKMNDETTKRCNLPSPKRGESEAFLSIQFLADRATYDGPTNTVRIPALDNNKLVVCAIAGSAILDRLWVGDGSPTLLVEIYRRHKKAFHLLARHKYRLNRTEPDGTVLIALGDVPVLGTP